jgi:hypothetical protein
MEKGEILDKKVQEKNTKRVVLASLLTATGTVSAGAGGYFFYKGFKAHTDYKNAATAKDCDRYWKDMSKDFIIAGCATGIAAVTLYFGMRLFFKKTVPQTPPVSPKKAGKASLFFDGNRIALAWEF